MPLYITIPGREWFNEDTEEFSYTPEANIVLEHSLLSISEWESRWHKPFFSPKPKTEQELYDYVRCMTTSDRPDENVYRALSRSNIDKIQKYIENPMTATTFSDSGEKKQNREIITSEIFYYWMTMFNIPFVPCETWHINKLQALIHVCAIKNQSPKKMSKNEIIKRNSSLNAMRRAKYGSKG